MTEFFQMGGDGAYVWTAYGITLVILIGNIWSARVLLRKRLKEAATERPAEEATRRPKISQL